MKQIFIVNGPPGCGKSTLFRKAVDVNLNNRYGNKVYIYNDLYKDGKHYMYYHYIESYNIETLVIDNFVCNTQEDISDFCDSFLKHLPSKIEYIVIITNSSEKSINLLISSLKNKENINVTICKFEKC